MRTVFVLTFECLCIGMREGKIVQLGESVDIIRSAMPPQALREKQHPAKRSFQAIRIAVNDELTAVELSLIHIWYCLIEP